MAILNYKNTNIHFTDSGKGNTVVLLHGFLENLNMWKDIAPVLAKTQRVICIDLLGHGKTENLGYIHTMETQAEMVKFVLDYLKVEKCIFIGHSLGGYIALAFAELYLENVQKICLLNSTALADSVAKQTNRDRAITAVKYNPTIFVKMAIPNLFTEKNQTLFAKRIEQITKEALQISQQAIIASLEGMKIRKDRTSLFHLKNIPFLMVIGKQDPALEYSSLIAQTKNTNVKVVEFPDGHMSFIENQTELLEELHQFCKD